MATVDLNRAQFWAPPSSPSLYKQRTISSQSTGRSICTNSSRNQLAPLHKADRRLKRNDQSKSVITAAWYPRDDFVAGAQDCKKDSMNRSDEADDHLPPIEEILGQISRRKISIGDRNTKAVSQDLDKPALGASGSYIGPKQSRLENGAGDSQGTQDRPVVIDDDEPDSTDDEDEEEAEATRGGVDPSSAEQDANLYNAFLTQDTDPKLCKPILPSSPERWYDVEASCYVDEKPLLGLELKGQEGSAASTPAHDHGHSLHHSPRPPHHQIGQHDDSENAQSTPEEPAPHSLPKPLDEDGGGDSGENVSDLERDMLLAFEELEKPSSATALSSPQSPCCYTEQSSPQIDQEHKEGITSYGRLEELGFCSPLRKQDQDEEEPQEQQLQQQQQQHEAAAEAMREEEEGDDDWEQEQCREKRRHQDEAEESSGIHHSESSGDGRDTSSENDEDPRLAKRRKLRSAPAHEGLMPRPQNLTPPSMTQLEVISTRDNQPESRKSSSPSPTGDEGLTSNASAAYQEWPMRGFFKLITIGNEVRYGMEFNLEDVQQLCAAAFPLHTSSAGSNTSFSARPSRRAQTFSACNRADNASSSTQSRNKRPRFTEEEDAKLVDLKERKGVSWEEIQRSFPGRSAGSLQVRYCTKLKERNTAS